MRKSKKICIVAIFGMLLMLLFSTYAYAANGPTVGKSVSINDTQQYKSAREARVTGSPRGRLISSTEITLTDKGNGTIGIYADLLCHQPMKELRIWLILEKWIPEEEVWESVHSEQFTWNVKDFPDQDLTMAVVSYEVPKMERGQDYHVRGLFGADDLTTELSEMWTMTTPDFFLE